MIATTRSLLIIMIMCIMLLTMSNEQQLVSSAEVSEPHVPFPADTAIRTGDASSSAPELSSITLYAAEDSWINYRLPNNNYGHAGIVLVGSSECPGVEFPSRGRGLFQFDLTPLPPNVTIKGAVFRAYVHYGGYSTDLLPIGVHRLQDGWTEDGVTWNNQPLHSAAYASANVPAMPLTWQTWDITQLVQDWYSGTFANYGLMLISGKESQPPPTNCGSRAFDDREGAGGYRAQLIVSYNTTPPQPCSDLSVDTIEVTQAIQDDINSVPLVANKRTYARGHVHSAGASCPNVLAHFYTSRVPGFILSKPLLPDNPGARITVRSVPNRDLLNDSFFVEIPPDQLGIGTITVCMVINPDNSVMEPNTINNWGCSTVALAIVPPVKVHIYDVRFWDGLILRQASILDLHLLKSWLQRAYPTADMQYSYRTLDWTEAKLPKDAGCGAVNNALATQRALDGYPYPYRYYGMVSDTSGFMRGCAMTILGWVASGPTGPGTWGWDYDGSYGDWYGGHELGHAYGLVHASFCGATGGGWYPYPGGIIGGPIGDTHRFRGFDVENRVVYPSTWTDVMTYCPNEWISDYTYIGIRDRLINERIAGAAVKPPMSSPIRSEFLVVTGRVSLIRGVVELGTFYRRLMEPQEGSSDSDIWQIVMYDNEEVLGKWGFDPKVDTDIALGQLFDASIFEVVPWQIRTTRIAILYQGREIASRYVSAHAPQVQMITPNGGENLTGPLVDVQWIGTDSDSDRLLYSVQYSPDAGDTWQTLLTDYPLTQYWADISLLPGSPSALFQVIASDGVNTGQAQSAGVFTVYNKNPLPLITSPISNACLLQGQQLMLVGEAYDFQDGPLSGAKLGWSADFQPNLGTGQQISVNFVPPGKHRVTLRATNSAGLSATFTTAFEVTEDGCKIDMYLPLILM